MLNPFQFSSNTPIQAIDLDGMESDYIINDQGTLTNPTIALLQAAFNYDNSGLRNVKWTNFQEFDKRGPNYGLLYDEGSQGPRNTYQFAAYTAIVTQGMGAITLNDQQVVYADNWGDAQNLRWLGLIAHEQSHVQDYREQSDLGFYMTYLLDNAAVGYRNARTEQVVYKREKAFLSWLSKNEHVVDYLTNNFDNLGIVPDESWLALQGRKFRYEVGIDLEISLLEEQIEAVDKIGDISKAKRSRADALIDRLNKEIEDLRVEKNSLSQELNGDKP